MQKPKLIYYNDARHYSLYRYDPPMSLHQLRQPVDELLGTGVDTLSFGLASGQTFFHDTKVGMRWGEGVEDHNHGVMWWRASEIAKQAHEAGIDPLKVVVDRAHEKGMQILCSMRMNDASTESNLYMMSRLKRDRPEVMIGGDPEEVGHAATCEDYAREDVREHRLQLIDEVLACGPDGLEMDPYIRVYFDPSQARQNAPILTEFVREARRLCDRRGEGRSQRLCLSTRVHPVEAANLAIGMDVRAWMLEGLVDLVVPTPPGALFSPEIELDWLFEIAKETGTWVYVPIGREPYDDRYHTPTIDMTRAAGSNFCAMGADGIYLSDLNWPYGPEAYQTMRELGDADVYARKSKHYLVPVRDAGKGEHAPERHLPAQLQQGGMANVAFTVSDGLRAAEQDGELDRVELGVRVVQYCPGDELSYKFNGTSILPDRTSHFYGGLVSYGAARSGLPGRINTHYWFHFDIPSQLVVEGRNELQVAADRIFRQMSSERILQSVELRVHYKEPFNTTGGQM